MNKNFYQTKNIFKTIPILLLCTIIIVSCKKELYQKESIDLNKAREIEGFKKDGKLQTITFDEFRSHVNGNGLGTLKSVLYSPKNLNNSKSTSTTLPEINGYVINTSEIKVLQINGSTNYVFSVLPLRPSAVTFRNVTIQEKDNVTTAIMTIYTPTKAWIQNNRLGKNQKFDGKVDVIPLNLNSTNILSISPSMESKIIGKTNALKTGPAKTTDAQYVCSFVNVWVETPYQCASGMGHWPWDFCNMENPEMRPGYRWEYQTQTTCAWIQTDPPPPGTGETTPNPPPGYDPCATGLPEGTQLPVSTIDETPCDSSEVDEENPGDKYELQILKDSINLKRKLDCFKNISNQNATYYIRICADIPNNSKPNDLLDGIVMGHAFITMTKSNGSSFISQTFGFYPKSGFKALVDSPTPSMIGNNQNEEYDASIGVVITQEKFEAMIAQAPTLAANLYDLKNYNCTDFAIQLFNVGSPTALSIPDWVVSGYTRFGIPFSENYGTTPNGLYSKINQMKIAGNSNASMTKLNAPASNSCN